MVNNVPNVLHLVIPTLFKPSYSLDNETRKTKFEVDCSYKTYCLVLKLLHYLSKLKPNSNY